MCKKRCGIYEEKWRIYKDFFARWDPILREVGGGKAPKAAKKHQRQREAAFDGRLACVSGRVNRRVSGRIIRISGRVNPE